MVSDFGIGPWRKRSMDFLDTFEGTYSLTELRIGAASTRDPAAGGDFMGTGGVARILKAHGGQWQAGEGGGSQGSGEPGGSRGGGGGGGEDRKDSIFRSHHSPV